MTTMPKTAFTPTVDAAGDPTTCFCCGMRAVALGVNPNPKGDPQYLCRRCIVAIDDYKKIRRLDDYELAALDGGVDAVGEWIAERGIGTELSVYDELDQRMLVKAAWEGCARALRAALASAPF
ncbi:DUF6511 domain-containing protein [Rhizobium esperanzae]|uniref:Uncharacterized protein n=1 Tax=Rhizobium esperanzae TaxID=1967781 RepID=A0A7W6W403_9HYPH|nr:DUF6511 domain-containing protein [Rhizobium esperanzae]MBB4235064.1 hypothetical protein [Rhizobium esperanzae]